MKPTYYALSAWLVVNHGFAPKPCWIAHCKELNGIPVRRVWNRAGDERQVPCPPGKRQAIEDAFRHFGLLPAKAA